ncbi:TPA: SMI1/KNR4 family protein [Enterobacter cloacae]|uniref:SMI1/KNR4 family protein n=1 Tax=Enterobacter cloacae TaxID=550 RepID=UPI002076A7F8|nr:SMI1/KNR4 family protein [Enterobacter cloacae]MCM7452407.1 SMI1/KNR4 family protein [Enterobacter cloacae]MDD7871745.1 SMI1/KNR4 family protein [Enterobacter cloacae complex sp. 2022EL-00981]
MAYEMRVIIVLLTINEIEVRLHEKFSSFNGGMDDFILKKRMAPVNNIKHSEERLGVNFPKDFIEFVNSYDIDNFSLGNISFGHGDDYLEKIVRINNDEFNHWWIGEHRPDGVICIAISDPYTILLNTHNGKVYAITSEQTMDGRESIADSFELFIRGVGSHFLKACPLTEIIKSTGANDISFWNGI